jgi:hypothetical protein
LLPRVLAGLDIFVKVDPEMVYIDMYGLVSWATPNKVPSGEKETSFPDPVGKVPGLPNSVKVVPETDHQRTYGEADCAAANKVDGAPPPPTVANLCGLIMKLI